MEAILLKILLKANLGSKEEVLNLIKNNKVKVNGKIVSDPAYVCTIKDKIVSDGIALTLNEDSVYYMLNKPTGYMTTTRDDLGRKTIYSLLDGIKETVYPIGRLDYDTSGLLILTNDKDLKQRVENPKNEIEKEYRVKVEGLLRKEESKQICRGVDLIEYKTKPCKIYDVEYTEDKTSTMLTIVIKEGKNREIRRVFEFFNHKVKSLKRVRIANITLDIGSGTYRVLKPHEVKLLKLNSLGMIEKNK